MTMYDDEYDRYSDFELDRVITELEQKLERNRKIKKIKKLEQELNGDTLSGFLVEHKY